MSNSDQTADCDHRALWFRLTDRDDPKKRRRRLAFAFTLVCIIGLADFLSGFQASLLVFYFIPISIAVAASGWRTGIAAAATSVATWLLGDLAAGARFSSPLIPCWNALIAFVTFAVLVWLLSTFLTLHRELETRVRQRTAALTREIAERQKLEKAVLEISDRERLSIGRDLHDGLGQHLTGTALLAQATAGKLGARQAPEAAEVTKIVSLVEQGIDQTRALSRGLLLAAIEKDGLAAALADVAAGTRTQFGVDCEFELLEDPVFQDSATATHLLRIAQEAVRNAVRHGPATRIALQLEVEDGRLVCSVTDNGRGLPATARDGPGLGLQIMAHRASMIGASFEISNLPTGGARVTCALPMPKSISP